MTMVALVGLLVEFYLNVYILIKLKINDEMEYFLFHPL